MSLTAIIAAIGGLIVAVIGFLAGHKVAAAKTDAAVADATQKAAADTETRVRQQVADQTAAAAGEAAKQGADIRTQATTQAAADAAKGRDALLDEMRKNGELE